MRLRALRAYPRLVFLAALVGLAVGSDADAQTMGPNFTAWSPDQATEVGGTVLVPIYLITNNTEGAAFVLHCECDSDVLTPTGVIFGPGMENQVIANGEPPECDVVIFPTAIDLYLELLGTYSSDELGFQFLFVEYEVNSLQPAVTTVNYTLDCAFPGGTLGGDPAFWTQVSSSADIHVYQAPPPGAPFIRGDANNDGTHDIADPVVVLNVLFAGGFLPHCLDAADANDDGSLDIGDSILLLQMLFSDVLPLSGNCEIDATPDSFIPCSPSC